MGGSAPSDLYFGSKAPPGGKDAGQSCPDQREKHGDGLDKHEPPTGLRTSEDPGTYNLHHVADWRR